MNPTLKVLLASLCAGAAAAQAAGNATAANATAAAPAALACRMELLSSYGLTPRQFSQPARLEMCKFVTDSCCEVEDQVAIYQAYREAGEAERLKAKLAKHRQVYADFLATAEAVAALATRLVQKLADKKVSNCKIMARRLVAYNVKDVSPKLKDAVGALGDFLQDTYKGFYCTLCDAKSHQFFDLGRSSATYSTGFCRDVVLKSLNVLQYFHVYFARFASLAGRMLQSCSPAGAFRPGGLDPLLALPVNGQTRLLLDSCRSYKDDARWAQACAPICQNFNLARLDGFFSPLVDRYQGYVDAARSAMMRLSEEEQGLAANATAPAAPKPAAPAAAKPKKRRRLQKRDEAGRQLFRDLLGDGADPMVFNSGLNAPLDLAFFKPAVELDGLELYSNGKQTFIDEAIYKSVKALAKMKKPTALVIETGANATAAGRSSAGLLRVLLALLLLLL